MFENDKIWCEAHGYSYKIIDNHFYWQTCYQTGEHYQDENNILHVSWHPYKFFDALFKREG